MMQRLSSALPVQNDGLHLAATMAAPRHPLRSLIVEMFRRGDLVSVHEAVLICDASRQAVTKWVKAEGIDIDARRLAKLAKLRTLAERRLDGLPAARKPSKAYLRRVAAKALKDFNRAQHKGMAEAAGRDIGQ